MVVERVATAPEAVSLDPDPLDAVSPDPLRLARRLEAAGLPHVALLHAGATTGRRHAGWGRASWLVAAPDRESHALDPLEDDDETAVTGAAAAAPRWVGVIPYEARRQALERRAWRPEETRPAPCCARPIWRRYPAAVHVEAGRSDVRVLGTSEAAVRRLVGALSTEASPRPEATISVTEPEPPEIHRQRIERARELILDGHLYQVNLARRLDLSAPGSDAWSIYAALHARAPAPFGAVMGLEQGWWALSTSPELLLEAIPGPEVDERGWPRWARLSTEPIKGTRPRGEGPEQDAALMAELDADPKERAELAMIVDVARNDLSRTCHLGSVRVSQPPVVVSHPTVHHRVARVVGRPRAEVSRREILEAMVPSGSVTGAPKQRAMEVIAELESARRGLYTGGLGYVSHDGGLRLAMAIRCAVVKDGRGHYWTGGGIVVSSDPDREVEETRWKARQLMPNRRRRTTRATRR